MGKSNLGLLVLLAKLGPTLFPVLVKMHDALWAVVKSLFGIKSVGVAGSVGLYTYLFTWQMGVSLVVFIAIHEYGHLWAMKRCGIKAKGMFFIPGLGAVAVAEERFGSARNEAYIAVMGPVFGLVGFVLPLGILYYQTGEPMWAAIAALMAFINLVNLFPINPLDGGRILKALAYSERQAASFVVTVVVSVVTAILGTVVGFGLLAFMAVVGLFETASEFGITKQIKKFLHTLIRVTILAVLFLFTSYLVKELGRHGVGGNFSSAIALVLVGICSLVLLAFVFFDIKNNVYKQGHSVIAYPAVILTDMWLGIKQVSGLRAHHIQPIENYDRMMGGGKTWYALCFLGLILVHIVVIYVLAKVPGAELARELLQ